LIIGTGVPKIEGDAIDGERLPSGRVVDAQLEAARR
jgi:hypothetical protein